MKKNRAIALAVLLVAILCLNMILLTGCGNKYYYNQLSLHIKEYGEKSGEAYRIIENFDGENGEKMEFDLYYNKTYSHFIAVTLTDTTANESLQLSIDPQLTGVFSVIPKIKYPNGDNEYILFNYNHIEKTMEEVNATHCKPENKARVTAINDRLLEPLLARFKAYIETHSAEMNGIKWMHLGFEPRPIETPATIPEGTVPDDTNTETTNK